MGLRLKWLCATALLIVAARADAQVQSQSEGCQTVSLLASMSRADSYRRLMSLRARVANGQQSNLVFAARAFELRPNRINAKALLALIPRNEHDDAVWHWFEGMLCDSESLSDMTSLAKMQERLPHTLASAVIVFPENMLEYVSYAYLSIQDPHSDFAIQMTAVCRRRHAQFISAVEQLSDRDRSWFATKIFDPAGCRPLALPEAE